MNDRIERHIDPFTKYPPTPFAYDPDTRMFKIGNESVPLTDYSAHVLDPSEPISNEQARELIDTSKLALNVFDTLVQMPTMYDWLKSLDAPTTYKVQEEITDIMIDAYATIGERVPSKLEKGSHWGFGMDFYRPGHPFFNVLGNCACYGVDLYGNMFSQQDWEGGFAEYGFHNIDWQGQRVALLAGAGALALTCERETTL